MTRKPLLTVLPTVTSLRRSATLRAALSLALTVLTAGWAQAAPVPGQGTWERTLVARDLTGDGVADAYYDRKLDITWLAKADLVEAVQTYEEATAHVKAFELGGVRGWRMPKMRDLDLPGCDWAFAGTDCGYNVRTAKSELAYMFHVHLGNKSSHDASGAARGAGAGLTNTGPFSRLNAGGYWFRTLYAPQPDLNAWFFVMSVGLQEFRPRDSSMAIWAVHDGDVGTPLN